MSFNIVNKLKTELGASLLEYVLLVSLIAVACIGAVTYFGQANKDSLTQSAECVSAAMNGGTIPPECND